MTFIGMFILEYTFPSTRTDVTEFCMQMKNINFLNSTNKICVEIGNLNIQREKE